MNDILLVSKRVDKTVFLLNSLIFHNFRFYLTYHVEIPILDQEEIHIDWTFQQTGQKN